MLEPKPKRRSRRAFLGQLAATCGALAFGSQLRAAGGPAPRCGPPDWIWQGQRGSHFSVSPNPPQPGQDCTVTYVGPETTVYFQVDGGKTVPVRPTRGKDGKKTFKIDKAWLRNGGYLFLTTKKGWPGFLMVEIDR